MKTFHAGKDIVLDVLFLQGMDTVVPDVGSVTFSLYSNAGVALISDSPIVTTTSTTSVAIPIASTYNGIGTDNFQYRTAVISYRVNGGTREQTEQCRLIKFITLPVSNDDVRALIGFSKSELPDEDIDLTTAYFEVADDVTSTVLNTALQAHDATTRAAQRLIICQAIIDLLPGLQFRVIQLAKSNTSQVSRVSRLDFGQLTEWVYGLYTNALGVIVVQSGDPNTGALLVVTTPSLDPVTAAAPV